MEFNDLNEYDLIELLKYVPLKERIRFERVHSKWAAVLEGLWFSQKQLAFGRMERQWNCHQFRFNDMCRSSKPTPTSEIFNIVSRCANLKALSLGDKVNISEPSDCANLATLLNSNCKVLEHSSVFRFAYFDYKAFYELFKPSQMFCCLINVPPNDVLQTFYEKNCDKPMKLKCIDLLGYSRGTNLLDMVLFDKVEHLSCHQWNVKFDGCINLKSLDIGQSNLVSSDHQTLFNKLKQLEKVRLHRINNNHLIELFENNVKLNSLDLGVVDKTTISTIFKLGGNLKRLVVRFNDSTVINDGQFWQSMSALTKLRHLKIYADFIDPGNSMLIGLKLVIERCTKLKYFKLSSYSSADLAANLDQQDLMLTVARKAYRQPFKAYFQFNYNHDSFHLGEFMFLMTLDTLS